VKWPIGLWLVSDESEGSRDQLELAMNYATREAAEGRVNHVVIDFGLDAVVDLRQQLLPKKGMMSPQSYAEAMRFLNRAERGFTRMKRMVSGPRGAYADSGISGGGVAPGRRGERRLSSDHAAERRMGLARQAFREGDYAQAQRECERAIRLRPRDANLHELRALCQFAQGSYKDAAANLYEVLPADPPWDWDSLMSFYPSAQTYTRQLRALEQYVSENPEDAAGRFVLAYHYLTLDERDAAVGQLRRVIKVEPRDRVSPGLLEELEKSKEGTRRRADAAGD
jgi:tetratricopeptide (TPR) repeat protein